MFDGVTAFTVSSVFALLGGGALALAYRSLPSELQPSARDWWVGTLMLGACFACFAWMRLGGSVWARIGGNLLWFIGFTLYWQSIRRLFAVPDNPIVFFVAGAGIMASVLFLVVLPHFSTRIALITLFGSLPPLGSAYTLWQHRTRHRSATGWALFSLFVGSTVLLISRAVYFQGSAAKSDAMIESKHFVLSMTPILMAAVPIVGTILFVILCVERIRRGEQPATTSSAR